MSRLIGVSAHRLAGLAICDDFMRKMCDFEAAPQRRLSEGKGLEASRATEFLSKSSAHRLAAWRCVGISAHRLAGLAICEDFMRKMGDFEAVPKRG